MEKIKQHYKIHFTDRYFIVSTLVGFLLLSISLITQFYASKYVAISVSGSVSDIILSNTPVYDVDGIFVYGAFVLFFIIFFIVLHRLNYAPFIIKSIAVFTIVRSIFVSLTHISPFPNHVAISSVFFRESFFSGIFNYNDLFFSGHTGIPFLMALIFWDNKKLRFLFLGFSILMAVVVLLGHLHYSIDVLSAFFITFSIFHICKFLFKKDWQLFLKK